MKRVTSLATALLLTTLLLVSITSWLTNTESGLRWMFSQAGHWLPGKLGAENIQGRLIGPLSIKQLDYQYNNTRVTLGNLTLDWLPLALISNTFHAKRLAVESLYISLPTDNKAQSQAITLPDIILPMAIKMDDFSIIDLQVSSHNQSLFGLNQFHLKARTDGEDIVIKYFEIKNPTLSATATGRLQPTEDYPHDLQFHWQWNNPELELTSGRGHLYGNLHNTQMTHNLTSPFQADAKLSISDVLNKLHWQATVMAPPQTLQTVQKEWPALQLGLSVEASGDLTSQHAKGRVTAENEALGIVNGEFRLNHFDQGKLVIEQLDLATEDGQRRVNASGHWQPGADGGTAELSLSWQSLGWPWHGEAQLISPSGHAKILGNINAYNLTLQTTLTSPTWPEASLQISGKGNLNGVEIDDILLTTLDGKATATALLDWQEAFIWQAKLEGNNINPGSHWSQWPGNLQFSMNTHGYTGADGLMAEISIPKLTGEMRGYPVTLQSDVSLQGQTFTIKQLNLLSANSRISATGEIGNNINLIWQLDSPELAELYPEFKGTLHADGGLRGSRLKPAATLALSGENITLFNQSLTHIEGKANADLFQWHDLDVTLEAQGLQLYGQTINQLKLDGQGTEAGQQLHLVATSLPADYELDINGRFEEDQNWLGQLTLANLDTREYGRWQLEAPVSINAGKESSSISSLCLQSDKSHLCTAFQGNTKNWLGSLTGKQIPMALLSPWLPQEMKLNGSADITLAANNPATGLSSTGRINLAPGTLSYPVYEGENEDWAYRKGHLEFILDDKGLQANSQLLINEQDQLKSNLDLPLFNPFDFDPAKQILRGSVDLNISELGPVESLLLEVQGLTGQVNLHADVDGTFQNPTLKGTLKLAKGSFQIPRLGLNITDVEMNVYNQGTEQINYQLTARSGKQGNLKINGQTQLKPALGWPSQIDVKGDSFEVSHIPEARITISPILKVSMQNRRIDVEGEVAIPEARLQPKDISTAKATSGDVIISGAPQPPQEKWDIYSKIRLILSDRVSLYGFGFEGNIMGNVLLTDIPGQPTTGSGELNVPEGRYRAYGQRLDIEHGKLLFVDSPLSNPGLDLQAIRRIQDITAGIQVSGTLRKPKIEVFSIPVMGQTDALAYLLLGYPLEQTTSTEDGAMMASAALALGLQGGDLLARSLGDRFGLEEMRIEASDTGEQTSLIIGRYLSPKLYVSYGAGLIDAVNTLTLRYNLSRHWQLKAESGLVQGADLLYTIER